MSEKPKAAYSEDNPDPVTDLKAFYGFCAVIIVILVLGTVLIVRLVPEAKKPIPAASK